MTVSVVVPYRPDGGHRDAAWAFVSDWWAMSHPSWQVVVGASPPGLWCKACAVEDALTRATGDILVVADADVLAMGVGYAVEAVAAGAPWCVPHQLVQRLTQTATATVLAGGPLPHLDDRPGPHPQIEESYLGLEGGGMVVLTRVMYERVPLDTRFRGYGCEDLSWALALKLLAGTPPRRSPENLWHLWHPPQARINRAYGSKANLALYERYLLAARYPVEMAVLMSGMADNNWPTQA